MAATKTERPRRAPINGIRNILKVNGKDPNYEYRIVNDVGDRVQDFIERGYEVVTDNDVTVGDKRVANPKQAGTPCQVSVGQGIQAFVMRIKKDWYTEDQATKAAVINQTESSMRAEAQKDGNYGSIKIETDK